MAIDLSAALSQIADQFFTGLQLPACWLIPVEVADQTNAKSDVIQVIAVDVTAIDLATPAIANFDFAVSSGGSISDNEMISKAVLHAADVAVVIIKNSRASLPSPAVVHNNELPAPPHHWRTIVLRGSERAPERAEESAAVRSLDRREIPISQH